MITHILNLLSIPYTLVTINKNTYSYINLLSIPILCSRLIKTLTQYKCIIINQKFAIVIFFFKENSSKLDPLTHLKYSLSDPNKEKERHTSFVPSKPTINYSYTIRKKELLIYIYIYI